MPVCVSPLVLLLAIAAPATIAQQPDTETPNPAPPAAAQITSAGTAQHGAGAVATIQTTAHIVVLDVVAADKHGQPVKGLSASDFVLSEDGVTQTLQSFTERDAAADQPAPSVVPTLPPNTFANHAPPINSTAMTVLLFDTSQLSPIDAERARQMVAAYMKTVQLGTPMCIFDLDSRGLLLIQDFTSDPKVLARAAESRRNAQWPATRFSARTLAVMRRSELAMLAHYLAGFPGRKNLIWFYGVAPSHIADRSKMLFPDTTSFLDDVKGLTATLTLSRVAVYPVDPRGVIFDWDVNREVTEQASVLWQAADAQDVAKASGGKAFYDNNDIKRIVAEVQATSSHYYTLSYSPTNAKWDGSFRKIQVRLANQQTPGGLETAKLRLEYRAGYYASETRPPRVEESPPANDNARRLISFSPKGDPALHNPVNQSPLEQAMDFGGIAPLQVLFQARVTPDAGTAKIPRKGEPPNGNFLKEPWLHVPYRNYHVHFSLDPRTVEFAQHNVWMYNDTIELNTVVYDSNGVIVNSLVSTEPITLDVDHYLQAMRAGLGFDQTIAIPSKGEFYLRLGVHDLNTGRIGAVEIPVSEISLAPENMADQAAKPN